MRQHPCHTHHFLFFKIFLTDLIYQLKSWVCHVLIWPIKYPDKVIETKLIDEGFLELFAINLSHHWWLVELFVSRYALILNDLCYKHYKIYQLTFKVLFAFTSLLELVHLKFTIIRGKIVIEWNHLVIFPIVKDLYHLLGYVLSQFYRIITHLSIVSNRIIAVWWWDSWSVAHNEIWLIRWCNR